MPIKVLKICGNTWDNASRDKRELSVYKELGAEVCVLAKGNTNDRGRIDSVDEFKVYRMSTRPLGDKVPNFLNRLVSLFSWASFAKKIKPDVITGHDLLPGLTISWMATWFNRKKPKLIYDSHEFELGRTENRGRIKLKIIGLWEKFLIKKCQFSIMVNDCIADEVKKIYGLKERPLVIRSTPALWTVDSEICKQKRLAIISNFPEKRIDFLAMHHGALLPIRGIEKIIEAVSLKDNVGLIILGNGDLRYIRSLKKLAVKFGVQKRVQFHEAVPLDELWKYVGAADVGIIAAPAKMKNALYSLPNKFFENIQSETPVICPNYPAMKELVDKYEIGLTCDPTDANEIAKQIQSMVNNKKLYVKMKNNTIKAKHELCWEVEKSKLERAFKDKIMSV